MLNQFQADPNESSFSTAIWKSENQLNAAIMYDLYMTHSDMKLVLNYDDDEIRRAQNKTSSERIEEYAAFPSTCSLELDLQI